MILVATSICKSYGNYPVLKSVDLSVKPGEVVAIMGASGAGKSTLLHILGTLDRPDQGFLYLEGQDLLQCTEDALATIRNRRIGFVFQAHHLLPEFTVLENVAMPGYIGKRPQAEANARAEELLSYLGLSHRLSHKPAAISGGEQQRVAVARALFNEPAIVFADEPSGSLDSKNAALLHHLFMDLRTSLGQTFVFATHNQDFSDLADRIVYLRDGSLFV